MVYVPATNTIVLEVAKSGSRSLVKSTIDRWRHVTARGHHTIGQTIEMTGAENPTVIAVVRDPAERFISALNFHFNVRENTLDSAMKLVRKNEVHYIPVFEKQSHFFKASQPHDLKLFPLHRISEAFDLIGGEHFHENKKRYQWPREQVEAHPLFQWMMEHYTEDFDLWQKLQSASAPVKASPQPTPQPAPSEPGQPTPRTDKADASPRRRKSRAQTLRSRSKKTSGKTAGPESAGSN